MDPAIPFDLHRMFVGSEPPLFFLEIVLRVVLIYGFAVVALRYMGKRGQRQMTPFEYMVIIALGSATGDSMFYPEVPIFYAWLVIAVIVLLDNLAATLQLRSKRVNVFMESTPRLLIHNGRILDANLRREKIRRDEFLSQLRESEVEDSGEIRYAFLEPSGNLGLIRFPAEARREGVSTLPETALKS